MKQNVPPFRYSFSLNHDILNASMEISYKLGRLSSLGLASPTNESIAQMVKHSLLLEGITLTPSQMRGLNRGEQCGVKEADVLLRLYQGLSKKDPYDPKVLPEFEAAYFPDGVPSRMVDSIEGFPYEVPLPGKAENAIKKVFSFASSNKGSITPLFMGALVYFEMNAIRPYSKGNHVAAAYLLKAYLGAYSKSLLAAPIEKAIYFNQDKLDAALIASSKKNDCAPYVAALLGLLESCIDTLTRFAQRSDTSENALVDKLLAKMEDGRFYSAVELLELLGLKSRLGLQKNYLRPGLAQKRIKMLNPLCPTDRGQRYAKVEVK